MPAGNMVVALVDRTTGSQITSVIVPSGSPACLTGVVDLSQGSHEICVHLYPAEVGAQASFGGASLQIILGQTVESPGCSGESTCG